MVGCDMSCAGSVIVAVCVSMLFWLLICGISEVGGFGICDGGVSLIIVVVVSVVVGGCGICDGSVSLIIVVVVSVVVGGCGIYEGGVSCISVGDSDIISGCGCSIWELTSSCWVCLSCSVPLGNCCCRSGWPLYIILTHLPNMWSVLGKCSVMLVTR